MRQQKMFFGQFITTHLSLILHMKYRQEVENKIF